MQTFVEFRSSKFPPYDGEEEDINPGLWGKRLAEYFVDQLADHGFEAEEIIAEDWGWYVPIANDGFRLALCCGHQYGDDDQFLVFTDPREPVIRKFLRKVDATEELTRLTDAVRQILTEDPEISDVLWSEPF